MQTMVDATATFAREPFHRLKTGKNLKYILILGPLQRYISKNCKKKKKTENYNFLKEKG